MAPTLFADAKVRTNLIYANNKEKKVRFSAVKSRVVDVKGRFAGFCACGSRRCGAATNAVEWKCGEMRQVGTPAVEKHLCCLPASLLCNWVAV
ncbi:MAG: hypothetical protein J1F06_07610 [Prevotellaceae bacterium]|nr:hypothetical protein [Prevotellaceae bacterium]